LQFPEEPEIEEEFKIIGRPEKAIQAVAIYKTN